MTERNVRIEPYGHLVIDAAVWVGLRAGGTEPTLTTDLHAWASQHGDDILDNRSDPAGSRSDLDWTDIATAWCQDRGHQLRDPGVITHAGTRLDAPVWVLLADTADGRRLAVVGINHDPPAVYLDTTGDPGWWYDANSVVIACPTCGQRCSLNLPQP